MILFIKDSGGFVASVAALIATGWSDPLPGGFQLPLNNNAFSRRTGFSRHGSGVRRHGLWITKDLRFACPAKRSWALLGSNPTKNNE